MASTTASPLNNATENTSKFAESILKKIAGMKPTDTITTAKYKELSECAIKYGGAFVALIAVSITVYVASTDDKALTEGFFKYMIFIIIPTLVGAYLVLPVFNQRISTTTIAMNSFIFVVMILALYVFYRNKDPSTVIIATYSLYFVMFSSIIIGLAILYKFMIRYIYNSRGWTSVILQIIFFIPCLLLDTIEYIKYDIGITPNTVYILLVIELIIIGIWWYLPKLFTPSSSGTENGVLLNEPVFLNKEIKIADPKVFYLSDSEFNNNVRTNYSISFWAFLNSGGNTPRTIFYMGNNTGLPITKIEYGNGKYTFYLTNNNPIPFTKTLPSQKWNYFVITYNENKVDLFVNGNLEQTIRSNQPTYTGAEVMKVGSSPEGTVGVDYAVNMAGGVSGAICNVVYHKTPMTQYDIISEYNLLMSRNPPIR